MFFFSIPLILQVLLIVHAFKTGRDRIWIYVMIFLPFAGAFAYLLIEVLPDFFRSSAAHTAKNVLSQAAAPNRKFEQLQSLAEISPTFDNLKNLGEEYLNRGQFDDAVQIFSKALEGPFDDDPVVLYKLSQAFFYSSQYDNAKSTLYKIYDSRKENSSVEVLSLLAKTEDHSGDIEKAENFYLLAANKGADFIYRYDYAKFLLNKGDKKAANTQFLQILNEYEILPHHYRKKNSKLIADINEEMRTL